MGIGDRDQSAARTALQNCKPEKMGHSGTRIAAKHSAHFSPNKPNFAAPKGPKPGPKLVTKARQQGLGGLRGRPLSGEAYLSAR